MSLVAAPALARPVGPTSFCAEYPGEPVCVAGLPACQYCHISNTPGESTWNPYGEGVRAEIGASDFEASIADALRAIEDDDSDMDGFTNLEEIEAGTPPGDEMHSPGTNECPSAEELESLAYKICEYDARYVFKKVLLDFCGRSPTYEEFEAFDELSASAQMDEIDAQLDVCFATEFWRGRGGVLWELAYPKVRPVQALKAGEDFSEIDSIRIADYDHDLSLFAYAQVDDHDARDVLRAQYYVIHDGTEFEVVDDFAVNGSGIGCAFDDNCPISETCVDYHCECVGDCRESVDPEYRVGMLTTRWNLLYNTMFTPVPRNTAAQAYRAFLGFDIAQQQGLFPIDGEPVDWDNKGVDQVACAVCHSTLEALTRPFSTYEGFGFGGRAFYNADRMQNYEPEYPGIGALPESGYLFGQSVANLVEWGQEASDSPQFAQAAVNDYWTLLIGRPPIGEEAAEFEQLWMDFMGPHQYSVQRVLRGLIRTEAYGVP